MKVDIWSDVMCPFCYIGKRKFETALQQFAAKDKIEVEWHSFQLDPEMKAMPGKDIYSYLAERKGQSLDWSKQVHQQVTAMAADAGLEYNFDKAVINNSFDAHRLIQFAKANGLGDTVEESLFKAYFTEGKDIGDHQVLADIAASIGLDRKEAASMLENGGYENAVEADINTAAQIGINGVPFFVLDNKYAVSGAQPSETFLTALNRAWDEYSKDKIQLQDVGSVDGPVCGPDGNC